MDFSRIPDPAFLKIYDYLPLEDGIRLGRVNKMFRRFAQLTISETKSLDLSEGRFRNINGDQLAVILDMCSSNLERIKFPSREDIVDWNDRQQRGDILNNHGRQLATMFSDYRCPRLIDIDLGAVPIDYVVFDRLIRNNLNIEGLVLSHDFGGFPDITCNNLKKLKILVHNNSALQSMIGRCPNLKELDLSSTNGFHNANVLDRFIGSVPHVNQIRFSMDDSHDVLSHIMFRNELVNFRNLHLTSLNIHFPDIYHDGDNWLCKIATTFPHLKKLELRKLTPTSAGIGSLAALRELEILDLGGHGLEQGIRQLARCKKLQKLSVFEANISAGTLVKLLQSCPHLEYVEIWKITYVANAGEAAVVLESLAGIAKRDIIIKFYCECYTFATTWKTEPVKQAIGKLEEIDGLKIKLCWYGSDKQ